MYPYNSCEVDENVSFRQYVEGFLKQDNPYAPLGSFAEVNAALAGIGQYAGKSFHPCCATCTVRTNLDPAQTQTLAHTSVVVILPCHCRCTSLDWW